jgi:iron-sulfur cluster assembly accessory protein
MEGTEHVHSDPPHGEVAAEQLIRLSAKAVEMVKEAMAKENLPDHALRVAVVGGGCSGYQYGLDFDKDAAEDDIVLEQDGVRILIDQHSASYLNGTLIDYVVSLNGAGFKFNNPKATRTCGCGSSFSA